MAIRCAFMLDGRKVCKRDHLLHATSASLLALHVHGNTGSSYKYQYHVDVAVGDNHPHDSNILGEEADSGGIEKESAIEQERRVSAGTCRSPSTFQERAICCLRRISNNYTHSSSDQSSTRVRHCGRERRIGPVAHSCGIPCYVGGSSHQCRYAVVTRPQAAAQEWQRILLSREGFWDSQGSILESREKEGTHALKGKSINGVAGNGTATTSTSSPACPFLVGLHPDEATEAIVDSALQHCLPFAVVPCCVYARLFPHRRYHGQPVRTHEQFCQYLQAKAPHIGRTQLEFGGQATVLYHLDNYS